MDNDPFHRLHFDSGDLAHPFQEGDQVKACILPISRRPLFIQATIARPVKGIADFYEGRLAGDPHLRRFFAHPTFPDHQAEAALRLHYLATLQPEHFGLDLGHAIQRGKFDK